MESKEFVDRFNNSLADLFGRDTVTNQAMWRIVYSDDQFEKRRTNNADNGTLLLYPEVRLLPKYQWIKAKYILEHLVGVPEVNLVDLPTQKMSYEIIWTFEDKNENYLPPNLEAAKFVINTVLSAMQRHKEGQSPIKKFMDEEYSQEASLEAKANRLNKICEQIYGEDASFHDSKLAGETVVLSDIVKH